MGSKGFTYCVFAIACLAAPAVAYGQDEVPDLREFVFEPMDTTEKPVSWALELISNFPLAGPNPTKDSYTERLSDFDFEEDQGDFWFPVVGAAAVWEGHRYFGAALSVERFERRRFFRTAPLFGSNTASFEFDWSAYAVRAEARVFARLSHRTAFHLAVGTGPAWVDSTYESTGSGDFFVPAKTRQRHFGVHFAVGVGLQHMFSPHIGAFIRGAIYEAPVLANDLGDLHNSGGARILVGMRIGVL